MENITQPSPVPAILAPAGNPASFLAAIAAGADAVYCGLKHFSARMEAKNFTLEELVSLTQLAHDKGALVYVTVNTLVKPGELDEAGRLLDQLGRRVKPDALIIQDLALVGLARQTGFSGKLILSTLANISFPRALGLVREKLGVDGVVIPRELGIDEIKSLALACPKGLDLEVFVHGALCYGVSGRCYWSSFFGGKSGLRGRCVQPCRRRYAQTDQSRRFFSCLDLSLDVLVKVLLTVPAIRAWKIEGRKKGPHYVYYTVKAYQILRDHGKDPQMKRQALELLSRALGRKGTHYYFLSQRPQNPVSTDGQTGSGLLMGAVKGSPQQPYLVPREALLAGDVLRLGYEDEAGHSICRVRKYVPKKGHFYLKVSSKSGPAAGTPVFLIDRREKALEEQLSRLEQEQVRLQNPLDPSVFKAALSRGNREKRPMGELRVYRKFSEGLRTNLSGLWLSPEMQQARPGRSDSNLWWWLPPVVWPEEEGKFEELVDGILGKGGRNFVLNAPWQTAFFPNPKGLNLWAGPFCNLSNALAVSALASLGFEGVIVSPELGREDYLSLPKNSPLPLGIVLSGNWPLCVSRILPEDLKTDLSFVSPKGEEAWGRKYGSDLWVYPNWKLDLREKKEELQQAGYCLFVHLMEPLPRQVKLKKRPGVWNWELGLL